MSVLYVAEDSTIFKGDTDMGGRVLFYGYFYPSAKDGITARAGGGLANATVLDRTFNVVDTCATDHDSVKLPASPTGTSSAICGPIMWVHNETAQILDIFPGNAAHIIGEGAAGAAVSIGPEITIGFWPESSTKWHTFHTEPTWTTIDPAITALAGGGLAGAYPCICHYNIITTCANVGDSVRLVDHQRYDSTSNQGYPITIIHNTTPRRADVFPGTAAHSIDALGAGTAFQLAANTTRTFIPTSSTTWVSIR